MKQQPEKENAKIADVSSIVSTPIVDTVGIANPTRNPQDGICNWCRNARGDIYCDDWPCCWNCLELQLDRERAIEIVDRAGIGDMWRSDYWNIPMEWEKN